MGARIQFPSNEMYSLATVNSAGENKVQNKLVHGFVPRRWYDVIFFICDEIL